MGDSGGLYLSTSLPAGKGTVQSNGPGLSQNDPGCSRLAQHVMVLGPGQSVGSDSIRTATSGSGDSAL